MQKKIGIKARTIWPIWPISVIQAVEAEMLRAFYKKILFLQNILSLKKSANSIHHDHHDPPWVLSFGKSHGGLSVLM